MYLLTPFVTVQKHNYAVFQHLCVLCIKKTLFAAKIWMSSVRNKKLFPPLLYVVWFGFYLGQKKKQTKRTNLYSNAAIYLYVYKTSENLYTLDYYVLGNLYIYFLPLRGEIYNCYYFYILSTRFVCFRNVRYMYITTVFGVQNTSLNRPAWCS